MEKMKLIQVKLVFLVLFMLTACTQNENVVNENGKNRSVETITSQNQNYDVLIDKLSNPWSIAMLDNIFYMTERNGDIIELKDGKSIRQKPVTNKAIVPIGEGGLLGFVLAPNFSQSKQAYIYHTYKENGKYLNRVILIERTSDGWSEVRPILEGIPGGSRHNGGRLAIGPDQNLYITTGDAGIDELAQNLNSLAGKILRLKLNGEIPNENPFPNSPVYSYGHRNSQGIAWSKDGTMYASEHGPSPMGGHDEINKIEPGKNYGWPLIIGDQKKEGMISPLYQTGNETWAPAGIKVNDKNELFITCLAGEKLMKYTLANGKIDVALDGVGRLRDVYLNGNDLYVITGNGDNDKLLRIRF
jgi:glucose/arabinose dehydrogenase